MTSAQSVAVVSRFVTGRRPGKTALFGGTFTKARVAVAPGGPIRIATHPAARVDAGELAGFVPAVASLPPSARVVLGEREAVVVLAGPVSDGGALNACFQSLDAIVQHARANGPIPVQAA